MPSFLAAPRVEILFIVTYTYIRYKLVCQTLLSELTWFRKRPSMPALSQVVRCGKLPMHTFKSGDFKDQTVEQAMLRDAPKLYDRIEWARRERIPWLKNAVQDFDLLREKLRFAAITATCAQPGCGTTASYMTLPIDRKGSLHPSPYYWCDKHEPWERSGISEKRVIHFDAIKQMKTEKEKQDMFKEIRKSIGIAVGTRITREFARTFFARLE
jgi:hypothetical protein